MVLGFVIIGLAPSVYAATCMCPSGAYCVLNYNAFEKQNNCLLGKGLCTQHKVANYSMVDIAHRLDVLVKNIPNLHLTASCDVSAVQGLANQMTDALVSNDVYANGAQSYLPSFVQRIPNNDAQALAVLGLTPNRLSDPGSGFYAAVYYDRYTGQYIVANRGTAMSPWHPITAYRDLATDIRQALGYPTNQYDVDARNLARALAKAKRKNVVLTGHSLGGGLASLEAYITGDSAVAFDAAGLSAATRTRDGATQPAAVVNVDVNGEFLGQMQGHSLRSDFACALNGSLLNTPQRLATLALLHLVALQFGLNYNQAMSPTTILPPAAGVQETVPLTQWSSGTTNSETTATPDAGTCLAQVENEIFDYHAADKVVHALNYELTQLICPNGAKP